MRGTHLLASACCLGCRYRQSADAVVALWLLPPLSLHMWDRVATPRWASGCDRPCKRQRRRRRERPLIRCVCVSCSVHGRCLLMGSKLPRHPLCTQDARWRPQSSSINCNKMHLTHARTYARWRLLGLHSLARRVLVLAFGGSPSPPPRRAWPALAGQQSPAFFLTASICHGIISPTRSLLAGGEDGGGGGDVYRH